MCMRGVFDNFLIMKIMKSLNILLYTILFFPSCLIQHSEKLSEELFINPPQSVKPRTWMHAMSGNMSKEGMTKDLEAISEAGIGGVLLFTVTHRIPQGNIKFNSPEYYDIVKHAALECERLGLSFGFHNCDGWSSSGGPWITPKESMRFVVSNQVVTDGGNVRIRLPQPTTQVGYYEDIAVLAYPALESDVIDCDAKCIVSCSDPEFDVKTSFDGLMEASTTIAPSKGDKFASIDIVYDKPYPLRSFFASVNTKNVDFSLWSSDNGKDYNFISRFSVIQMKSGEWCQQGSFPVVEKKYFRITTEKPVTVKEIQLSSSTYISNYLAKNCLGRVEDEFLKDSKEPSRKMIIDRSTIKDLLADLDENGVLSTSLPKGKWTIMRIGCTTTAAMNHPASVEGCGLECDKFSLMALEKHFNAFPNRFIDSVRSVAPKALQYVEIDSYEMGGQNWTDGMLDIFRKYKGYDFKPFLPLLLGKYVDSAVTSEEVLSDYREVCARLMNNNYYGAFKQLCEKKGIQYYLEPYGFGPFNFLEAAGVCDVPMGEFWMDGETFFIDPAISGAHIYGKNIVSAESFTSGPNINWKGTPAMTKPTGDWAWKKGFNEFMFHRYTHQSNTHVVPGMSMSQWGFNFDRTQTWWDGAGKSWFKYLARGSYMLRLGIPVTDMLVFIGDGSPNGTSNASYFPYKSDAVNSDVLINRVSVKNSEMVLPEGTTYRFLVLRNTRRVHMKTLERMCELAEAGVPICGDLPETVLGYNKDCIGYEKLNTLVARIKACPNYYSEENFNKMIRDSGITPDFYVKNCPEGIEMDYAHRHLNDGTDIYFISNTDSVNQIFDCSFRVSGLKPELWYAMDGRIEDSDNYFMSSGRTEIHISLEPQESVFVVFREPTSVKSLDKRKIYEIFYSESLNNNWKVKFMPEYGYDKEVDFPVLSDWSKSDNEDIKFYSGKSIYTNTINIDESTLSQSEKVELDLGKVGFSAEVKINGRKVGIKWMKPYKFDVSEYLKIGENIIEIIITNEWTNRLIGDARYPEVGGYKFTDKKMPEWFVDNRPMPATKKMTFDVMQFYKERKQLLPAGLIGPVKVVFER